MATVKTSKLSRAERARQTRGRIIDCARELFVEQGYAATTMEQIAAGAGVAVQTVYYTFKTKGQLLAQAMEVAAAGDDGPVPPSQPPWAQEMLAASCPQRVLALGVEYGTGIYPRVAELWPAVGAAAAADPYIEEYWRSVVDRRRGGQRGMVARVAELGGLRSRLDLERATDLVVVLAGPDTYRGLVQEARWTVLAYKAWLFTTLVQQLLEPDTPEPEAADGLSFAELLSPPTHA